MSRFFVMAIALVALSGCASITNDSHQPVALSFSDGSEGKCKLWNKREVYDEVSIPSTTMIRRSDDLLQYDCASKSGKKGVGGIPSTMGGKIVASAVFLDFGIVDSITDKHREYPQSFVIPVKK
jgi:hypothetical protein